MVYILLGDGFEEIEALTQIDYLRRAGIDVVSVGIGKKEICGAHNIVVKADIETDKANEKAEMIILPGGLLGVASIEGSQKAMDLIKSTLEDGRKIAAICAAPSIIAKIGALKGKKAVCYPGFEDILTQNGAEVQKDKRVVTDGNITTAKAAGVSEEFSFELINILKTSKESQQVRQAIFAR